MELQPTVACLERVLVLERLPPEFYLAAFHPMHRDFVGFCMWIEMLGARARGLFTIAFQLATALWTGRAAEEQEAAARILGLY